MAILTTRHRDSFVTWRAVSGVPTMVWFAQMGDPLQVAQTVFEALRDLPAGRRVIFCWGQENGWAEAPELLLRHGPNNFASRAWFRDFFVALRALGAKIDMFALDHEYSAYTVWGGTFYGGSGEQVQKYYGDPIIRARMNAQMLATDPKTFARSDWWNYARSTVVLGEWGEQVKFGDLYDTCFAPYVTCFNNRFTNYGLQQNRFPVLDINGWEMGQVPQTKTCSPVVYIWNGKSSQFWQKHPAWTALINALNVLRTVQTGIPVYPWFSMLHFSGDVPLFANLDTARDVNTVLWEHSFRMDWTLGIHWNAATGPGGTVTDEDRKSDDIAMELLSRLGELPFSPSPADKQPLAFDCDSITTAGYTTTYSDFLKLVS